LDLYSNLRFVKTVRSLKEMNRKLTSLEVYYKLIGSLGSSVTKQVNKTSITVIEDQRSRRVYKVEECIKKKSV
jgi:hypothetical protein